MPLSLDDFLAFETGGRTGRIRQGQTRLDHGQRHSEGPARGRWRGQLAPLGVPGLVQVVRIPEGEAGTAATIEGMTRLAMEGARDPEVVQLAHSLVRGLDSKDYEGELERVFAFVKQHCRYTMDPRGLEWIQGPRYTALVSGTGDCDDHAVVLAALSMALGHGARFKTVKADQRRPDEYSHVYAMLGYRKAGETHWFGADTTQAESYLGWEPARDKVLGEKTWPILDP